MSRACHSPGRMSTTTRIWESPPPNESPTAHNSTRSAQLPSIATLTNNLPAGAQAQVSSPTYPSNNSNNRDSDQWPSQPQSTRKWLWYSFLKACCTAIDLNHYCSLRRSCAMLTMSIGSSAYSSGLNGYYQSSGVSSPHRASNSSQLGATSHPADYPFGNSQVSPGFAPPQQSLGLPNLNQDGSQYRNSHEFPPQESRRSSVGSQVNNGFTNMHINGAPSPYAGSKNASQSSIALNLQRERGMNPAVNGIRNSRASSNMQQPMSPLSPLPGETRQAFSSRTAPVISANPIREVYNADKPTAGQPYAFPDPDMSNRSSGSADDPRSTTTAMSRRDSDHTSVTSSIFTTDSRLPPGQHRLEDSKQFRCFVLQILGLLTPSAAEMSGTHHHSLQHKQVSQLTGESDSPDATSPYSRTPALRASHKLAERKRRTEMKYLFDGLRSQIPASHGSKSSKWEILSKGGRAPYARLLNPLADRSSI